jgi:hypothetical protein
MPWNYQSPSGRKQDARWDGLGNFKGSPRDPARHHALEHFLISGTRVYRSSIPRRAYAAIQKALGIRGFSSRFILPTTTF